MSIFYLVFSFIDLFLFASADIFNGGNTDTMFLCVHRNYLLPKDDEGAMFLLGDALIMYLFSLIITHIFYKIPYNHGLLLKLGRDSS